MPLVDERGRQLIAQRNNFGAAKHVLAPDDVARLARMQTNKQARAVLGVVAQVLKQGYQISVPLYARAVDSDSRELQRTMTSRLDATNKYAQKVYAGIPDDDTPVSDLNRKKVGLVLLQARDAVKDVDEAAKNSGLMGALSNGLDEVLGGVWANRSPETKRWLIRIGVGAAIVIGLFMTAKFVHAVAFGEASSRRRRGRKRTPLEEAEAQAAAIVARLQGRHRSR